MIGAEIKSEREDEKEERERKRERERSNRKKKEKAHCPHREIKLILYIFTLQFCDSLHFSKRTMSVSHTYMHTLSLLSLSLFLSLS